MNKEANLQNKYKLNLIKKAIHKYLDVTWLKIKEHKTKQTN